jgi:hypothetical protein
MRTKFWLERLKERDNLGDLGVDVRIILIDFKEIVCESADWIQLAFRWPNLVNTVLKSGFHKRRKIS